MIIIIILIIIIIIIIKFWPFIKTRLKPFPPKGVWKKALVVAGDSNPGPLALATSALTTEVQQPSTSKIFTFTFILLSSTLAAVLYSTDHQLSALRTPFRCQPETPPPPERSHSVNWKGFILTIIKFLPFIKTRFKLLHLKGAGIKQRKNVKKVVVAQWLEHWWLKSQWPWVRIPDDN